MEDRDPTAGDLFHWPMPLGLSLRWVLLGSDPAGRAAFCLIDDAGPRRSRDIPLPDEESDADLPKDEQGGPGGVRMLRPDFTLEIPVSAVSRADRVANLGPSAWSQIESSLSQKGWRTFAHAKPGREAERGREAEAGQDAEARDYLRQLERTRALIESYLRTGVYRLPTSSFEQDPTPAEAQRPALAAAGAESLLESLRRELREDAFFHLDLETVFPGRLEILAVESGLTLLHDACEEQAEPPRVQLALNEQGSHRRELLWQGDESLRWSRLSEVLPWSEGDLHLSLTRSDGEVFEFEFHNDRN